MKKRRVAILNLIFAFIITILCGCAADPSTNVNKESFAYDYERFSETHYTANITVITDNQTGCQYIAYRTASGTGLTALETKE